MQVPAYYADTYEEQARTRVAATGERDGATWAAVAGAIARDLPVTWDNDAGGQRVVHLPGLHSAPCGGTHVRSLGDLTDVVLATLRVRKGRLRVSCSAGHRKLS